MLRPSEFGMPSGRSVKLTFFVAFFIMETSFLLAGKITELTLIVLMGVALVKAGLFEIGKQLHALCYRTLI